MRIETIYCDHCGEIIKEDESIQLVTPEPNGLTFDNNGLTKEEVVETLETRDYCILCCVALFSK